MDVQVVAPTEPGQQAPLTAAGALSGAAPEAQSTKGALPGTQGEGALSPLVAKIFAQSGAVDPVNVNVSYRVEKQPDMVVIVFTDPQTGREISQVPSEVVVQLAQFFDKHSGVAVDKSA